MVEAVAMRTTGFGGDCEVHFQFAVLAGAVFLGPKRVLHLSLAALDQPQIVHHALDAQCKSTLPNEYDGRFVLKTTVKDPTDFVDRDRHFWIQLTDAFQSMGQVLNNRLEAQALSRLINRGLAQIVALMPSDASHVLGSTDVRDQVAAENAQLSFVLRRMGAGVQPGADACDLAQKIVDQLTDQTALALLQAAFVEKETNFGAPPITLAAHPFLRWGLSGHRGILKIDAGLNVPVVGFEASESVYYQAVGERLICETILASNVDVTNTSEAVVGRVSMRASDSIINPSEGH